MLIWDEAVLAFPKCPLITRELSSQIAHPTESRKLASRLILLMNKFSVLLYRVDEMRSVELISTEYCAFLGMLIILRAGMYMFSITVVIYVQDFL